MNGSLEILYFSSTFSTHDTRSITASENVWRHPPDGEQSSRMETSMKKVLLSLAATLIMVAGFATSADAQRRGGAGFYRGGGVVAVGGPGFRRAGFVGGPRWAGGYRWAGGPRWWGPRRFVGAGIVGVGLVGAGAYYGGYGGGCRQWQVVGTPWGPQWRLVNVCYAPVGYGYGYGYGFRPYPVGFYGGIY